MVCGPLREDAGARVPGVPANPEGRVEAMRTRWSLRGDRGRRAPPRRARPSGTWLPATRCRSDPLLMSRGSGLTSSAHIQVECMRSKNGDYRGKVLRRYGIKDRADDV